MKKDKHKKNKGIKIGKIIIFLIAIAIITISLTKLANFAWKESRIYEIKEINATFGIGKTLGLAVNTEEVLNFGIVGLGGSSTKQIKLYHEYKTPAKVEFFYTGNIAKVLGSIEPFILEPKIEKNVSISAYAISDKYQNYSGKVKITLLKV